MEQSKHLRVRVFRDDNETVNLTMPIYSLTIIDTLIPENIKSSLKNKNIDLGQIVENAKASNYAPQTLFEDEVQTETETKRYNVWIE